MSFTFQWPRFSDQFHADAIQMLNNALNKGNKPPVIADKIEVVELEMGTQPPELEIRDIGDLTVDQFRGIFRLTYAGDAHLVLKTKVQANPLNHKQPDIHLMTGSGGMLAAKEPLVVPMLLRLSHFKLNSYVVLVVSKQKGITLVFKTDPLQNVDINSTFDSIGVIQKFIQREIEGQLRQMFREDLPGIIHRLSQQWVKAKVEAPYLDKRPPPVARQPFDTASVPNLSNLSNSPFGPGRVALQQSFGRAPSVGSLSYGRVRSASGVSVASLARRTSKNVQPIPSPSVTSLLAEPTGSLPDLENFDPTYGLRPEGLPTKSGFLSFGRLFGQNKGLADLTEEQSEVDEGAEEREDDKQSYSVLDWEDTSVDYSPPASSPPASLTPDDSVTEYETIPAVGGGTVVQPRVYHSQSMIQSPAGISRTNTDAGSLTASTSSLRHPVSPSQYAGPSRTSSFILGSSRMPFTHRPNSSYNPYSPETSAYLSSERQRTYSEPAYNLRPSSSRPRRRRPVTPDSVDTQFSQFSTASGLAYSVETPPSTPHSHDSIHKPPPPPPPPSIRRLSISSSTAAILDPFRSGSPPPHHVLSDAVDPKIVLRPTLNGTLHQWSTLSYSNHTLSPYTRSLAHFAVRSGPPRTLNASGVRPPPERRPVKAKRKRTHRIGGKGKTPDLDPSTGPSHSRSCDRDLEPDNDDDHVRWRSGSPVPPSEFDQSEMDQYFRAREEVDGRRHGHAGLEVDQSLGRLRAPLEGGSVGHRSHEAYETLRRRRA